LVDLLSSFLTTGLREIQASAIVKAYG